MKAFCGHYNRGRGSANTGAVERMLRAQARRAPDGQRIQVAGPVALGVGEGRRQMSAPDFQTVRISTAEGSFIAGDVRLDNRMEVAKQLGVEMTPGRADEELILFAYAKWGEGCL